MSRFPSPTRGASLLLCFSLHARTVVIVGSGKIAANRAFACLETDAHVVLLGRGGPDSACEEVRWRVDQGEVKWRSIEEEARLWRYSGSNLSRDIVGDEDEEALQSVLSSLPSVSLVCITDTVNASYGVPISAEPRSASSAERLYKIASCMHRVPTNTTDMPSLCDFTFPSTHRFRSARTDRPTSLQIGVTTNSKGCRLSSRIAREIVARLPVGVGDAVDNLGRIRDKAKTNDAALLGVQHIPEDDCDSIPSTPNELVRQTTLTRRTSVTDGDQTDGDETSLHRTQRRMRWTAQISEYWPIESLASLNDEEIDNILNGSSSTPPRAVITEAPRHVTIAPAKSLHLLEPLLTPAYPPSRGRILLVGSGPGHPSLLTLAGSHALQTANLVLSDKLVPEGVLQIIPKQVELRIARKFPGNADGAQDELMHAALQAAQQGKIVVRLKQGDPMLYARASSEIEFFTTHGYPPAVVPGLSSALAAPLSAGIPVTARGVAEGVAICTGVGKGGKSGRIPPYERSTTVLVLMGVARLAEIVHHMVAREYPDLLPVCIIERGTMPDQRVVRSTLGGIVDAMSDSRVGPQRPPGMMVVGWACLGVVNGIEGVSDDEGGGLKERDEQRIIKWLCGERFAIKEGLDTTWRDL